MNRQVFNLLALVFWLVLLVVGYFAWGGMVSFGNMIFQGAGIPVAGAICAAAAYGIWVIQGIMAEQIAPFRPVERQMTPEERRAHAERNAEQSVKRGAIEEGIMILEAAGIYAKALEVAEKHQNREAMARLLRKMKSYSRARRLYLELNDVVNAAQAAMLMDDLEDARELYRKAAETCVSGGGTLAMEGGLWDRAGERARAAQLYEEGGELDLAAELHGFLGDMKRSTRLADQARALKALERKQKYGANRQLDERRIEAEKLDALKRAEILEAEGDFLGAGLLYRAAERWMEAGVVFEKCREWERAAAAFDKAGLTDRAAIARMHVEEGPKLGVDEEDESSLPPPPDMTKASAFVPISRNVLAPVFAGLAGAPPPDPEAQAEIAKRVRRGNFREAADLAREARDWLMAAAYYERANDMLTAADLYRQIGDYNAAAYCLKSTGRPVEAAHLLLAGGEDAGAVEALLDVLKAGGAGSGKAAMALGELLVKWKKPELAMALLREKIAPEGVAAYNAEWHYRFADLFEKNEAWREARSLYSDLASWDADYKDVEGRFERVDRLADQQVRSIHTPLRDEPDSIENLVRSALPEIPDNRPAMFVLDEPEGSGEAPGAGPERGALGAKAPREVTLFGAGWGGGKGATVVQDENEAAGAPAQAVSLSAPDDADDPFSMTQRYERQREIGRGGMGVIYEAKDRRLGRRLALKVIQSDLANRQGLKQFLIEARAIAMLSHPNVVVIYDIGMLDYQHYIAMEWIDGGTLTNYITREKKLTIKEAVRIFVETARGLQTAHENGIIHRDIKPANVLLTDKRQAKLVDFGLAMIQEADGGEKRHAMFRASGTPGFMPPEQYEGVQLLPRCDIYALGIVLFCMLVGEAPHQIAVRAGQNDIRAAQLSDVWPKLRDHCPVVPRAIEQVYEYCTAPNPEERYQSVGSFLPSVEKFYEKL